VDREALRVVAGRDMELDERAEVLGGVVVAEKVAGAAVGMAGWDQGLDCWEEVASALQR